MTQKECFIKEGQVSMSTPPMEEKTNLVTRHEPPPLVKFLFTGSQEPPFLCGGKCHSLSYFQLTKFKQVNQKKEGPIRHIPRKKTKKISISRKSKWVCLPKFKKKYNNKEGVYLD